MALVVGCLSPLLPATTFELKPGQSVVGELKYIEARGGETMLGIAHEFDLGYEELVAANPGLDSWGLKRGARIVLPLRFILPEGPRRGIYINMASYRMYYYPKKFAGGRVITYPVSVGRGEWPTPEKATHIVDKLVNPNWYPPKAVREEHREWGEDLPLVVPPGPDNPLGGYALQLGLPGYLIHGTNKPYGIGMNVTHGCVRLRPHDVVELFRMVPRKTEVRIINEPYMTAVQGGVVYLEAHVNDEEFDERVLAGKLTSAIRQSFKPDIPPIDWRRLAAVAGRAEGVPAEVSWGWREETVSLEPTYFAARPATPTESGVRSRLF